MIPPTPQPPDPGRRKFLRTVFVTTAAAAGAVPDTDWLGLLVCDTAAAIPSGDCTLQIRVSDFPALAREGGSVRIGTSPMAGTFPRGLFWPVIVNRSANDRFYALESRCTHADCVVRPYSASARSITCPCHGSRFAIDGSVLAGPAGFPLTEFETRFDGADRLDIAVPNWVFLKPGTGRIVASGPGLPDRFELEFATFTDLTYELQRRATIEAPWQRIPFALTPDGPIDQTALAGRDDTVKVYVERPAGSAFFAVSLRTFVV